MRLEGGGRNGKGTREVYQTDFRFRFLYAGKLEEIKTDEVRIEAGKRAMKYEEKTKTTGKNKIILKCQREIEGTKKKEKSKWEKLSEDYYRLKLVDIQEINRLRASLYRRVREDKQERTKIQEKYEKITWMKYNRSYKEIRSDKKSPYTLAGD